MRTLVPQSANLGGQSSPFVAENQRHGRLPVHVAQRALAIGHKGVEPVGETLPIVIEAGETGSPHLKERAHGGADGLGVVEVHRGLDDGEVGQVKGQHGAEDGSQVAGVAWIDQRQMVGLRIES